MSRYYGEVLSHEEYVSIFGIMFNTAYLVLISEEYGIQKTLHWFVW